MNETDVIIVNFPNDLYDEIVEQQIKYAIISLPFTIDRMNQIERYGVDVGNLNRIKNIFKGKIAEGLFSKFAELNKIDIDFEQCSTPFYQVDNRDFLYKDIEFDLKNNFIFHSGNEYDNYTNLPAMIPNRFQGDQWSSRLNNYTGGGVAYLFSFLRGATLNNGNRGDDFVDIKLTNKQAIYLSELYHYYNGQPQNRQPFSEEKFWARMATYGGLNFFELNDRPKLAICGIGNNDNWNVFKDVGPLTLNNYQNQPINNWYKKVGGRNSIMFLNGTIWGTITNRTSPIQNLIPFTNVFNELDTENLIHARFKE
jgi:hypothetical protein